MSFHSVMDAETLSNFTLFVFEDTNSTQTRVFRIWHKQNQFPELLAFLREDVKTKKYHISFNGLAFDAQITHFMLEHAEKLLTMTGDAIAKAIYAFAQRVITCRDRNEFLPYYEKSLSIPQIDIFKANHWDGAAKSSSLKWLQYSMDWFNVEEMPINHTATITTDEEADEIELYCKNDVSSTKELFHLSKGQILLRKSLTDEYKINLLSASEPKISKDLFGLLLSKKLKIKLSELKKKRTYRKSIKLADCILPNIQFKTREFQDLHNFFKSKTLTECNWVNGNPIIVLKGKLNYVIKYKGVTTKYGAGGVHGAAKPGIYTAGNGKIIMSSDVTSFYPNLGIRNGFCPAQLPTKEFLELYEWIFEERKKISKKDARNYVYKIILNATYGLSNEANSFLYDPLYTCQITINGQLQLSMLYEMLAEGIPGAQPLMQNTDGLEMIIPEEYKGLYLEICAKWEKLTNLQLEHDEYAKMIIADVNSYIGVYNEKEVKADEKAGKTAEEVWNEMRNENMSYLFRQKNGKFFYTGTKCKGRLEWEPQHQKAVGILHKNKSFLVIPKAVFAFFMYNMNPETYLKRNTNVYDYCAGIKGKGDWRFKSLEVDTKSNQVKTTKLNKIVRYYISKKGTKLIKYNLSDSRELQVHAGHWLATTCNNIKLLPKDFNDLDINQEFYLDAIYKEIQNISPTITRKVTQLEMF